MTTLRLLAVLTPLLLGGCLPAYEWYQPGFGPDEVRADRTYCAAAADREAFFSRPRFFYSPAYYEGPRCDRRCAIARAHQDEFRHRMEVQAMTSRLQDFCMRSKGYSLREIPAQ